MYRPQRLCKAVISLASGLIFLLLYFLTGRLLLLPAAAVAAVWVYFYLSGIAFYVSEKAIVKTGGIVFSRAVKFSTENMLIVETVKIFPALPAAVRITYPGKRILILGLDGRQVTRIENRILKY